MALLEDVAHIFRERDNVELRRQIAEKERQMEAQEALLVVWRRYPMIWLDHPSKISEIPDHDAAIANVMFSDSHCRGGDVTEAEAAALHASFQSVAGTLSAQVVWKPRGGRSVAHFELPCSVLRRWLSADRNVWTYLPTYRDVDDTCVWFVLDDEHEQPEGASDFSLMVCHNYPSNAVLD